MITLGALLYAAGGTIFCALCTLHDVCRLMDLKRPCRLVPVEPTLITKMAGSRLRPAGDATDVWRAWIGVNLSH